ncbi:MAG TPA: hypothetical protein PLV82_04390, partial [bacterium]|nr:hypothetical protein [bacterium]
TGYSSCTIPGPLSWESTYYWKVITSNGALTNEAFGSFKITYPSAWWQTKTGDVYGNEIFSPIWREATSPYFSLIGPFGPQSGLVAAPNCLGPSGARCNFGAAQATQTNFLTSGRGGINANFTPLLDDYSYDQLAHLVDLAIKDNKQESFNSEVKVISGVSADKIEKSELTDPDDANKIIYYYFSDSGSVSVDSPLTMGSGDKKLIIFIDGDLHINKNITVSPGFLAFIVSGDIEIAADVTQVKGVYFADGSLTVESNGATDSQFNGQGIFVGKEGISLKRDFRSAANATTPTEIFTLDPAYLFTAPKVFREKPYLWQEVIP